MAVEWRSGENHGWPFVCQEEARWYTMQWSQLDRVPTYTSRSYNCFLRRSEINCNDKISYSRDDTN